VRPSGACPGSYVGPCNRERPGCELTPTSQITGLPRDEGLSAAVQVRGAMSCVMNLTLSSSSSLRLGTKYRARRAPGEPGYTKKMVASETATRSAATVTTIARR
jgi:hypothetical protein